MPVTSRSTPGSIAARAAGVLRREFFRRLPIETLQRRAPRDLVAFSYHVVADERLPHISHIYDYKTAAEFEADVVYLKNRYLLPTWPEFLEERTAGRASGRQSAMLTFDDGMAECFDIVRPILLKHRVPCVFFVSKLFVDNQTMFYRHKVSLCLERVGGASTEEQLRLLRAVGQDCGIGEFSLGGFTSWLRGLEIADEATIDRVCGLVEVDVAAELARRKPYLTSRQITQLAEEGFTIGGHTVRHARLQLLGDAACDREIVESCEFVGQLVGAPDVPFAFPFGGAGLNRRLLGSIVERHPLIKFMFDTGGLATDAPFIIHRIAADEPTGMPAGRSGLDSVIRSGYAELLCGRPVPRSDASS